MSNNYVCLSMCVYQCVFMCFYQHVFINKNLCLPNIANYDEDYLY